MRADDVICVHDPACPPSGITADTMADAETLAEFGTDSDTLRVGPGTFQMPETFSTIDPLLIFGAGREATTIEYTGNTEAFDLLTEPETSINRLTVRLTNPSVGLAVRLSGGADADQVGVTAPPTATIAGGIFVEGTGSVLRNIRVALGTAQPTRTGVHFIAGGRLEDSFVQAGIGVSGGTPALEVRRTVVRATIGFRAFGGQITLTNALVTQHPLSGGASFDALEATNGNNPADPGILKASNVTIDGEGPGFAVGAAARLNSGGTGGASIGLEGAVIRNVDRTFDRLGDGTNPASITVGHSSYDATKVSTLGPGTLIQAATNITNDPDPRFLGPAHLDYRLRHDSPLLERGDPTPIVADEDPDLGGRARVRDSDGDGTALVDIGAFEYQRLPPTAAFTVAPSLFGGCLRR